MIEPVPQTHRADRPVHWLIVLVDERGKLKLSRSPFGKHRTPAEACQDAFGLKPTGSMRFYNLTTRLDTARKLLRQIAAQYR